MTNGKDYLIDAPIESANVDRLGFGTAAESLLAAITNQPNSASLTLGLDGAWGSGKSSLLHLLRDQIPDEPKGGDIGLVVVQFSPWLVTNRTALIASFFAQLSDAILAAEQRIPKDWKIFKKAVSRKLKSARKKLNRFSRFISISSSATTAFDPSLVSAIASGSAKAVEKLTEQSEEGNDTLEALKGQLTESLSLIAAKDPSFRILVLIDDLDRLDPGDVLEVLRLVKAVGDFPAISYLLAYDRGAVSSAIEQSAAIENGDEYLEKIIQYSFKIPPLEPFQLRNWLKAELEGIFPGELDFTTERAVAVLDRWAGRLLSTPRDVKRLLFAVRAVWPQLRGRADLLDLIWLQMIALKAASKDQNLYSWLVSYLQGLEAIAIGGRVTNKAAIQQELENLLEKLGWGICNLDGGSMSMDFHHLEELLAGVDRSYLSDDMEEWVFKIDQGGFDRFREEKRLSSPWHWRLYFALEVSSAALTDSEWEALKKSAAESEEALSKTISKLLEFRGSQRRSATDQIQSRVTYALNAQSLPYPDRWLIAFAKNADKLSQHSRRDTFGFESLFDLNLRQFAKAIFKVIEGDCRKSALEGLFTDPAVLHVAAEVVRDQHHASKKYGFERDEKLVLTDNELSRAISQQLTLYESLDPDGFVALNSPYSILFAWRDISGSDEGPRKLLERAMVSDEGFLDTLSALRIVSSSAQNGVPHISESYVEQFMEFEQVKKRLEGLSKNKTEHSTRAKQLLDLLWFKRD